MALQHILKNSAVSGKEPTASQLANGEIALNYHADGPFLSCKDTSGTIRRITGVWISTISPSTPTPGELWLDISTTPTQLKVYKDTTDNWIQTYTVAVASTTVSGIVELATDAETITGADALRAVTPASLQAKLSDSTGLASSTRIASSTAVKSAYDLANAALPQAGGTITGNLEIGLGSAAAPTFRYTGDTNTGLFSPGADQLSVTTGGVERLRIDATGQIESVALGSAAAPTYTFTTDSNTGIYSPGADQLAISTGGAARFRVDGGGNVALGPSLPAAAWSEFVVTGNAALQAAAPVFNFVNAAGSARFAYMQHTGTGGDFYLLNQETGALRFGTSNGEKARIDSVGRLLVGISSSRTSRLNLNVFNAPFQIESDIEAAQAITRWSADISGSRLHLQKGRGTIAAPTSVASGDFLADITFSGFDGTNMTNGARIEASVDGTPGPNDMPGRLVFSTTADGASSPTEKMRIDNAGNITWNGAGIKLTTGRNIASTVDTSSINILGGDITTNPGANIELYGGTHATLANLMTLDANEHRFRTANGATERMRIDSSGRLLVGTSTAYGISGLAAPDVQLSKANQDSTLAVTAWKADSLAFNPTLQLMRSYNNTTGTHTAVPDGARLGAISFAGSDGSVFSSGAAIVASADGQTWASGDCPGRLIFSTTADGASTPTERMRIDSSGRVGIGTNSPNYQLHVQGSCAVSGDKSLRLGEGSFTYYYDVGRDVATGNFIFNGNQTASVGYVFQKSGTELCRIDTQGRLLVGTSTARTIASVAGSLQLETTGAVAGSQVSTVLNRNTDASGPRLLLARTRGTANGQFTAVIADDQLGNIRWHGADGTSLDSYAAEIAVSVDGTPGTNDMPGRLVFSTTADGASTPTERMRITNAGVVGIGTGSPIAGNLLDVRGAIVSTKHFRSWVSSTDVNTDRGFRQSIDGVEYLAIYHNNSAAAFEVNGSERLRIDASGRLLVGTSTARSNFYGSITPNGVQNEIGFGTFFANTTTATGSAIYMGKSRGTAAGSNTVVLSGDQLGAVVFFGADGANAQAGAQIVAEVDGTPGLNDMPGRLVFSTTADGASSPTERLRIDSSGQLTVATKANGLTNGAVFNVPYTGGQANGISLALQVAGTGNTNALARINMSTVDLAASNAGYISFATSPGGAGPASGDLTTERMRIDSSGNVLIGTSASRGGRSEFVSGTANTNADFSGAAASFVGPGSIGTATTRATISVEDNSAMAINVGGSIGFGGRYITANTTYAQWAAVAGKKETGTSGEYGGYLGFYTRTHTVNTIDERMRIDSIGRVGIGTTGPTNLLTVYDSGTAVADLVAGYIGSNSLSTGESRTWLTLQKGSLGGNYGGAIGGYLSQGIGGGLIFGTQNGTATPVERVRIDHTGLVSVVTSTAAGNGAFFVSNPNNTSGSGVATLANRANNNNTSSYYLVCQEPGVANRCFIYGNGNLANLNNVYGAISDIKLKENITDASSQWNDIKNLQIRKYNFKQNIGYQTHTQIGLVAQEAELVSPGLVYETPDHDSDGNDLGTVTKSVNYSVLYMKAVKALQEAIDRIETLEAKVAALEAP